MLHLNNLNPQDFGDIESASFAKTLEDICRLRIQLNRNRHTLSSVEVVYISKNLDTAFSSLLNCLAVEQSNPSVPTNFFPSLSRVDD